MPRYIDRRTVLQTTGGVLAGATIFTGSGAADDGLVLDVQQEAINPDKKGRIPVKIKGYPEPDHWTPDDVWFGHKEQFDIDEESDEGESDFVSLPDNRDEVLAQPVHTTKGVPNPDNWIEMKFRTQDIDFSLVSGDEVVMGIGIFTETTVSTNQFDENGGPLL